MAPRRSPPGAHTPQEALPPRRRLGVRRHPVATTAVRVRAPERIDDVFPLSAADAILFDDDDAETMTSWPVLAVRASEYLNAVSKVVAIATGRLGLAITPGTAFQDSDSRFTIRQHRLRKTDGLSYFA
jgi:hypothetical protein